MRRKHHSNQEIKVLQVAVEGLYTCKAKYKTITRVTETLEGALVWDGDVYPFDLIDHPAAADKHRST